MSWLCRQCETVNTDDVIECEVCDAVSPYLSRFDYDEITPSKPTTIRWKAEECDCMSVISLQMIDCHISSHWWQELVKYLILEQ